MVCQSCQFEHRPGLAGPVLPNEAHHLALASAYLGDQTGPSLLTSPQDGEEDGIGNGNGKITWPTRQDLLLVEQLRWILLKNLPVMFLELRPNMAQHSDCTSLGPSVLQ